MPKKTKWEIVVKNRPNLSETRAYAGRVLSAKKNRKPAGILVGLEHIDDDQAGRTHETVLPLPLFPGGRTTLFFRACGFSIEVDQVIDPRDAIGAVLMIRFTRTANNSYEVASFEPAPNQEAR